MRLWGTLNSVIIQSPRFENEFWPPFVKYLMYELIGVGSKQSCIGVFEEL